MSGRISAEPETWGPAILAILADHHGLAYSPADLRRLFPGEGGLTLAALVEAAEAFGFETQAGRLPSYDDLKELPVLPAVVHLRRRVPEKMLALRADGAIEDLGREGRFAVIHAADGETVDLEDPAEGRSRIPRQELEAAWRGIVVCVAPADEQARRQGSPPARLAGRLVRAVEAWPLLASLLGCGVVGALGFWLATALGGRAAIATVATVATVGLVAAALAASIWALRATVYCAPCAAAASKIGLPLAPLGILYYAGLLVALGISGLVPLTVAGILAAAGVHLALLAYLAGLGVRCTACTAAAAAAWTASGLALGAPGGPGWGWHAAVLPAVALAAMAAVRLLTRRAERLRQAKLAAVREILATEDGPSPGGLRLIVFKRETCPKCRILEQEILPPLAASLGERLAVERRPAGAELPAPTLVFLGGGRRVAIVGLPDADDLREALAGG